MAMGLPHLVHNGKSYHVGNESTEYTREVCLILVNP